MIYIIITAFYILITLYIKRNLEIKLNKTKVTWLKIILWPVLIPKILAKIIANWWTRNI